MKKKGALKTDRLKKLLLVAVTTAIIAISASGCTYSSKGLESFAVAENSFIVVSENGKETLHKGDIVTEMTYWAQIPSAVPTLKFNCGEKLYTSQFVGYGENKPSEENYDDVCEFCFGRE